MSWTDVSADLEQLSPPPFLSDCSLYINLQDPTILGRNSQVFHIYAILVGQWAADSVVFSVISV